MKNTHQFISVLSLAFLLTACGSDSKPLDTDGDGVPDSADLFPSDPKESKDTDADNIGDNTDNCLTVANTDQLDQDLDGIGDACDEDIDGDGVLNSNDALPQDPNETLDTDKDTIGDNADNCPQIANTDQTNTDANFENGDTFGDVCDADIDADGVLNTTDVFPLDPDESVDDDGDNIGDNKDLDITSPNNQVENSISLTRLLATGRATRFIGPQTNTNTSFFNNQVINAGDVNNDGFDDMLVGIPSYKQDTEEAHYTGIVYLFFGGKNQWPQTIDLNNIPETVPHIIFEKQTPDDSHLGLGINMLALGDVNGDTIDDFAIGAYKANSSTLGNVGAVHIVYGRTSWLQDAGDDHTISYSDLKSNYTFSLYGDVTDTLFGFSVADLGDYNGDGLSDIAVGQPYYYSTGETLVGRIYVLFGGAQFNQPVGTSIDIASIPDTQRVRITGSDSARHTLGYKILPLGNFDNDANNTQDILVRSGNDKNYYVLFGQKNLPANIELTYPMTDHGFILESSSGFLDEAVGHLLADASNTQEILLAKGLNLYIIKGGVGNWPASIDIANLPVEYGIEVPHSLPRSSYASLAMLPDSNQDGLDEPLISSNNTADDIGRVQKIENTASWLAESTTSLTVNNSIQNIRNDVVIEDTYFFALSVLGDIDNDDRVEFVLNAPRTQTINGIDSGDFYVVEGFSQVYPQ